MIGHRRQLEELSVRQTYLERQPRFDFVRKNFSDASVEVREDLHSELRLDATISYEVVEGIGESHSDTVKEGEC